jgi:hypothetical protein
VNPEPPGATLVGTSGSSISGTGLGLCPDNGGPQLAKTNKTTATHAVRTDARIVHSWGAASCGCSTLRSYSGRDLEGSSFNCKCMLINFFRQ